MSIKNTGTSNLTYAVISYWVKGGPKWYYEWTGNLLPFETEKITLPAFDWNGLDTSDRVFYAEAKWPIKCRINTPITTDWSRNLT